MSVKITGNFNLDPDDIMKKALLADIVKKVPEAAPHKRLIKFTKVGGSLKADLSALPTEVVEKINKAFE